MSNEPPLLSRAGAEIVFRRTLAYAVLGAAARRLRAARASLDSSLASSRRREERSSTPAKNDFHAPALHTLHVKSVGKAVLRRFTSSGGSCGRRTLRIDRCVGEG